MKSDPQVPGPGQYTPKTAEKDTIYSVPKARRRSLYENNEEVPGPGTYQLDLDIGGPKYKISKAERYFNKKLVSPGPGAYDLKSNKDAPSYSINAKRSINIHEQVPGPGTYSPSVSYTSINYSIGKSLHYKLSAKNSPGPGTYSPNSLNKQGVSIGNSQRPPLSKITDTPGPGAYDPLKSSNKAPSYSLSIKNHTKKLDPEPVFFI